MTQQVLQPFEAIPVSSGLRQATLVCQAPAIVLTGRPGGGEDVGAGTHHRKNCEEILSRLPG